MTLRNLDYYRKSDKYNSGVTCNAFTLNNEKDIVDCLQSLRRSKMDQLILVDGGSKDRTIEKSRPFVDLIIETDPGFITQGAEALKKCENKYVIGIEADHRYPENFVQRVVELLSLSEYSAIQPLVRCSRKGNFFERGMAKLYIYTNPFPREVQIISGPVVTYAELYLDFLNTARSNGASIDSNFSQFLIDNGHRLAVVDLQIEQYEEIGFLVWLQKFLWYGSGDYDFYRENMKRWGLGRKIFSITHPFRMYMIRYPLLAIREFDFSSALFFVLSGCVRYLGWAGRLFWKP
jgi:glycosyltransferase involved in cell wall biosynthesis